jgi:hypothetical protein
VLYFCRWSCSVRSLTCSGNCCSFTLGRADACRSGDAEQFYDLGSPYDEYPDFWPVALRGIARNISEVTPEIQQVFRLVWIETKMLTSGVDNHPALCKALRTLMPNYTGEALRLFRGASALERKRAAYRISWTSSLAAAQDFAESYRVWPGGSVMLETIAPPEAIISVMEYDPPLTEAERRNCNCLQTQHQRIEEAEYLVDRRLLTSIKVQQRFEERSVEDAVTACAAAPALKSAD